MKLCPSCHCGSYGAPAVCPGCGADLSAVADCAGTDLVGMVIDGKYELVELVGEGAMGWVYRGLHRALQSTIAVKLMKPAGDVDETRDKRFEREARAASRLNNPHIISIMDFGRTAGGILYIISEFLRGKTLQEVIEEQGGLPLPRALGIMDQVLSAVEEAHAAGLVHRDLKPENIVVTEMRSGEDFVKVLDFGIAKLAEAGEARLTMQGQLFGTPAYMAPEQIRGREVTERTDLYACAVILYEMLAGREPFRSDSVMEVLSMHLHNEPEPLRTAAGRDDIPEALAEVVMQGLAKDPEARFPSARAMREALADAFRMGGQALAAASVKPCLACGQPLAEGTRYCPSCGAAQAGTSRQLPSVGRSDVHAAAARRRAETLDTTASVGDQPVRSRAQARADHPELFSTLQRRLPKERTVRFRLVARGDALRALDAFLSSDARALEVVGPVGSGRTRILAAAAEIAQGKGLRVVYTGADPHLTRLPWYPVQRMVRELLALGEDPVDEASVGEAVIRAGLLAADVPGILELFGASVLSGQVEYAVRRREAYASVRRLLREGYPVRGGLCLLLDDWDEYDGATQAFLRELLSGESGPPLYAVVATERPGTVGEHGLRVELSPLPPDAVEVLLGDALGAQGDSWRSWVAPVHAASAGLPLHVEQVVRLVAEGGGEVDASLADLVALRIGRLPSDALHMLQAICVLGSAAPVRQATALYSGAASWQEAVTLLGRRGWIVQEEGWLRVTHPYLAEAVRAAIPADAGRALHRRALELLRSEGASPIYLAGHAEAGQAGADGLDLLRSAGEQAEGWLDDVSAARFYRQALHLARYQLLLDPDDPVVIDLEGRLVDTLRFSGDLLGADLVLREALEGARHRPGALARLLRSRAQMCLRRGDVLDGISTMREAVRQALFAGDPESMVALYSDLGRLLLEQQRAEEAVAELEEGAAMATGGEGPTSDHAPAGFWRLLLYLSEAHLRTDARDAALQAAAAALTQAEREGSTIGQARSHFVLARVLEALGRADAADQHDEAALSAFRRLGDRKSAAECLFERAGRRPAERDRLLHEARALASQVGWEGPSLSSG